jgi:hypothetical protein
MPSVVQTGNSTHDAACAAALQTCNQAIAAAAGNAASIKAAEQVFYRAVVASCIQNNNGAGVEPAMTALRTHYHVTGQ